MVFNAQDIAMFVDPQNANLRATGVFDFVKTPRILSYAQTNWQVGGMIDGIKFDLSRVVPVADENRPISSGVFYVFTF